MNKFYLINYNRLSQVDTVTLINIYLDGLFSLRKVAHDVILNEYRLTDNDLSVELLTRLLEKIDIEDVWHLASYPKTYNISTLAYQKIMQIIDEYEINENRPLIKIIK